MKPTRAALLLLGSLACGPSLPQAGDVGDESSSDASGGSGSDSDTTASTSTESTDDTGDTTSDDSTSDECPTELHGDKVVITDESDLTYYACLEEAYWIDLSGSFTDLSFLAALETVDHLGIEDTPALTSLAGLDSLHAVKWMSIAEAPNLIDLSGLPDDVEIDELTLGAGNAGLTSIAMPPLGAASLRFAAWDRPTLDLLQTASPPPHRIEVAYSPVLGDLGAIADCCLDQQATLSLSFSSTPLLTNLQGLEPFTTLFRFELLNNPEIASLAGLANLAQLDTLILDNGCTYDGPAKLADLQGLEQLTSVDTYMLIRTQNGLTSLAGLSPTSVAAVSFEGNSALEQALIDAWLAAVMPARSGSCGSIGDEPCDGFCPQ